MLCHRKTQTYSFLYANDEKTMNKSKLIQNKRFFCLPLEKKKNIKFKNVRRVISTFIIIIIIIFTNTFKHSFDAVK